LAEKNFNHIGLLTTAKRYPRHDIGGLAAAIGQWLQQTDPPKQLEEWL